MADQPLDIGLLGYRFMGRAHANALDRLPMFFPDAPAVNKAVLVGRNGETLRDAADRLGFDSTTTDWEVAVEAADVFYNLGPNHLHVEPSVAALEAGTPVLCEKPLAPTREGAERMAAAARETEVPAATAFNYRYVPAIQYARTLIADGALGEIRRSAVTTGRTGWSTPKRRGPGGVTRTSRAAARSVTSGRTRSI